MMVAETRRGPVRSGITRDQWDEAQMELASLRYEAIAHVARLVPLHHRLYSYALAIGPAAEQTVVQAMAETARYKRRVEG